MRSLLRSSIGTLALVALGACSRSSGQQTLPDDLKQDLARVGGGDVQLAGLSSPRLDVVSAGERTRGPTPTPRAPAVTRAASPFRGTRAMVKSAKRNTPVAAPPAARSAVVAPAEVPQTEPAPEPVPTAAGRPEEAARPSTQREPRGGWKTPGQIIRNAPFPINP